MYGYGGYNPCCPQPVCNPCEGQGQGRGFALIVVLFILLIIVGAACIR